MPDLADGDPQISQDGKTVTVKLKTGVMFSRPGEPRGHLEGRQVRDRARLYRERARRPYVRAYFGDVVGAPKEPGPYRPVSGIQTPDDQTIVFKLSKGTGAALAGALAMPISIPVPKEYALKYDRENPSTYAKHMVFTGPYMLENDAQGNNSGYVPGKEIHMVRNPDYEGRRRLPPGVSGRDRHPGGQRRHRGGDAPHPAAATSMASGEIEPPANQLKRLLQTNKTELSSVPGGGWRSSRWTRAGRRSTTSTCARP